MDIIIIEDEDYAARDLRRQIETLRPDFRIQAVLDSVEAAVAWFGGNREPSLIFSDIQLGDGCAYGRVLTPGSQLIKAVEHVLDAAAGVINHVGQITQGIIIEPAGNVTRGGFL